MDLLFIVICACAIIGLIYAVYSGKHVFMNIDMFCCAVFGVLSILFPSVASKLETDKADEVVLHMVRVSGCVLVGIVYLFNQVQKSADATVHIVLMVSRLVSCTLIAACGFYHRSRYSSSTDYNLLFISFNIALAVSYAYFLLNSSEWGGHTQLDTRANLHLRLDFFATLVFGILFYAFPEWLLSSQVSGRVTRLQEYSAMLFGAYMIGSALVSSYAPGLIIEDDQRAQFQGRIMQNTILLLAMIYAQVFYSSWTAYHVYFGMGGCMLWTVNALAGLASPKEIEEVKSK